MSRPDIVLERVADGAVGVHDFKTTSADSKPWRDSYEESVQMALQVHAAQSLVEKPVRHYYVHGLVKGLRGQEYNPETGNYDLPGPYKQNTKLLYAYYRPANPPTYPHDDWKSNYKYHDPATGKNTTLKGKGHVKVPVWEYRPIEGWVAELDTEFLEKLYPVVGPLEKRDYIIQGVMKSLQQEEANIISTLWAMGGDYYQELETIEHLVPKSWNCRRWNKKCQFFPVCHGEYGLDSGEYEPRVPHHAIELQRALEHGYEFDDEALQEVEE
jgi:hypothetical protein